ncbi:MAG TPA: hypothetical protein VNU45_17915 [Rummeliibacillus sp.]|nr:hypothetical protein [Rummeliibacillus sp.]
MLGGERRVARPQDLAPVPSISESAGAAFIIPAAQVGQVMDYIWPGMSTEKQKKESAERLSVMNETLNAPGQSFTQQALNSVSGIVGGLVPTAPFAAVGGAIGTGVASAIGFGARSIALELAETSADTALTRYLSTQVPISKLVPEAVSHFVPNKSIGALASMATEGYTAYKGMIIPEHFAEHYNAVNNSLDSEHAIQDWASDNYGFLLGAAPLAAGYVAFKGIGGAIKLRKAGINKRAAEAELTRLHAEHAEILKANEIKEGEKVAREAKVSELQSHLQHAEDEGLISPEMHSWYLDYLENPNHPEVHKGAIKALQSLQIPYDRVTGRVWNQVLSPEGVKNLKASLFDQHITNFSDEENQLLSSYIVHNEMDAYIVNMRENPNLIHAMEGLTHNIGLKIGEQSRALKEFDHALTRELPKGLLKRMILSQNNIYQNLKKFQESKISGKGVVRSEIPHHVPKDVMLKLRLAHQIKLIEGRKTAKYQRLFDEGKHLELKKKLKEIKLMHPADELMHIKNTLLPEGKLISDFKNRTSYHRLEDLSQVWPNAKVLLDRIHMDAINVKQQGLNEVLKKFLEMVDSNSARLADPDNVKRYLNSRMEKSVPSTKEFEQSGIKYKEVVEEQKSALEAATKPEVLYDETSIEKVKRSEFKEAREDFENTERKYKQFSENETALKDLITCYLGEA